MRITHWLHHIVGSAPAFPLTLTMNTQEGFSAYLDEAAVSSDVRVKHMPFLGYDLAAPIRLSSMVGTAQQMWHTTVNVSLTSDDGAPAKQKQRVMCTKLSSEESSA